MDAALSTVAAIATVPAVPHFELTGLAIVALAALVCGIGMERLGQPAIVGYILAGILLGPSGAGIVSDRDAVGPLAELGVLLLLYVVGMELSLRSFRRLWRIALLATLAQIALSVGAMLLLGRVFGWPWAMGMVVGFALALSSTAVAIKMLEDVGELRSRSGRIAAGVLIAQDLAVVPMLLAVAALDDGGFKWTGLPAMAIAVGLLVALIWFLSRRERISLPLPTFVAAHGDLKPLAALAFCFGAAALSGLAGLSAAYGAFLAGLVIGNSRERKVLLETTQPIQSILLMAFFLSIGLLLDLRYVWQNLGTVAAIFVLVTIFKTVLNIGALRVLGQSWPVAFLAGTVMAQVGEFSFLISVQGVAAGVLTREDSRLIVAVTVLSLGLSPLSFLTARRLTAIAKGGIDEAGTLLTLLYGREADAVAETLAGFRSWARKSAWRLGEFWRAQRARKSPPASTSAPVPTAARPPANDPGSASGDPPERRRPGAS